MKNRILSIIIAVALACLLTSSGQVSAQEGGTGGGAQAPDDLWPREVKLSNATAIIYQPQVEKWEANRLYFRGVVAIKPTGSSEEIFGVISGSARTQVDRINRMVTFEDLKLTKSNFPTLPDQGAAYMRALQNRISSDMRTIALDRIEASLAASGTVKPASVPVNNDPPRILISYSPAILIPIDGNPVLRPVTGTSFKRVINTQALILREKGSTTFYLHVYDGWLYAGTLQSPWFLPMMLPPGIDQVAQTLSKSGLVDMLDGGEAQPKPSLSAGVPVIYVSETPTELLVFKGQPVLTSIQGTSLWWASNSANDVFFNKGDNNYYVLISGRWYRAPGLNGPWAYVASTNLPADFRRIPPDSPRGIVLASVAGTPQAQEALIANSIPQTATVPRAKGPQFTPSIDGPPQFRPVEGTTLQYVINSSTAIIQVNATTYYALQTGIWYSATSVSGPWVIATSVPAVIYSIPATSPLHYATYVYVYGSTADVVYVGYTPGYLGTVVAPDGVVVYGTGYVYQPWVGTVYYAPPVTYGVMAQPIYNPAVGMTYGFAMGVATASAAYAWGATPYYHPAYYGGYPCCGSASASVYGQYGSTAYSGTRSYYANPGGTVGTTASGTYHNYATGTSGSYAAGRSYNPYTGQAAQGYDRTVNTAAGGSGNVARGETYNAQTGQRTTASSVSGTTAGGSTYEHTGATTAGPEGYSHTGQTTTYNAQTGQTKTYGTGSPSSNNHYSDSSGNVYKSSESGWEQHTSSGWQSTSKPPESVQNEAQARNQGEERFNSFKQSGGGSEGWAGRSSGEGGWGHSGGGGGGWGGRSGGGGGFRRR